MKKLLLPFLLSITILNIKAQLYDSTSTVYIFGDGPDTVYHQFTNCPSSPFTDGILTVSTDGDFGSGSEIFTIIGDDTIDLGGQYSPSVGDCPGYLADVEITIPLSTLTAWAADSIIDIWWITSSNVDDFCNNLVQFNLRYESCVFGLPVEYASFADSLIPDICTNSTLDLSSFVSPLGGVLSGSGVTGNIIDANVLDSSTAIVYYNYTDSIGCTTTASASINLLPLPNLVDLPICPDSSVVLGNNHSYFNWYENDTTNILFGSGVNFTSPALTQTTTYYGELIPQLYEFSIDTLTGDNFATVNHNNLTGDDRGGIAVTDSYVYVVGDNNTARYDLNLTPSSGVSLPIRDGIFSDIGSGRLYSLFSSSLGGSPGDNTNGGIVDYLVEMDDNLNFTSNLIPLSQSIDMTNVGNNNNGIFAGWGMVILYSDIDTSWYKIDISTGSVLYLGGMDNTDFYYSENWADWGVAEYDGTNYSIIYRDDNYDDIMRRVLPNGTPTAVASFSDLSDLSSLTYSPWNNRWYFHYESSGQFINSSENLIYADASHTLGNFTFGTSTGCRGNVTYTVDQINLGADTTICDGEDILINAGLGYNSYTWNGVNNNLNSIIADSAGSYVIEAINSNNCTVRDTLTLLINPLPSVNLGDVIVLCNYELDTLNAGNGFLTYDWSTGDTSSFIILDGSTLGNGTYSYELSVTDINGCVGQDQVFVLIEPCLIVEENQSQNVQIFPNPNNGEFSITFNGISDAQSIQVINLFGQVVYSEFLSGFNTVTKNLNLIDLPSGIYHLVITTENKSITKRFNVQH